MSKFAGLVKDRKVTSTNPPRNSEIVKLHKSEIVVRGPGRPTAKRSNPDYRQITCIIRKDTHTAAQRLLIGGKQDFSELVEELVAAWVKEQ